MRRVNRRFKSRAVSRGRLFLFLAGGVATAVLLVAVLIFLEQRSPVQSAPSEPPDGAAPRKSSVRPAPPVPPADNGVPAPAPETFTFYDTLEQRGTPHLGFIAKTTTSSETPSRGPAVPPPKKASTGYTVQIAATRDRATAESMAGRLRRKGYSVFILPHVVPKRGTWYRVRVGHFTQRQAAQEMTARLSGREHLTAYVVRE
ncbi:MAG TPA: SPOR domain-containing protein [Nitrospiria bacterium]|jgi:cell division septation protein DedD|nr:SPOR domain-containing protein [Nitrospiria bacterium]